MSISTKEGIVTRALRKLGSQAITSISSTTDKNAIIFNSLYDDTLEYVLSESFWGFAMKRIDLVLASSSFDASWTKFGMDVTYVVPSDFVRLKGWSVESARVIREGTVFRSDTADLGALYVYYNTTIASYPVYFTEALVDRLALDGAYAILQDPPIIQALEARYQTTLASAMAKDTQDGSQASAKCDAWINGRYSGYLDNGAGSLYFR